MWRDILSKIKSLPDSVTAPDLAELLSLDDPEYTKCLFRDAYMIKEKNVGKVVYLRGLIEISNICEQDCYYCGIRRGNKSVNRFVMTEEEVIEAALWAWRKCYGSVVLQAGERRDDEFAGFIENVVREIKLRSNGKLGVTLSLGEQDEAVYRRWFDAGAHRYLLRIETSEKEFFKTIHPGGQEFESRLNCLKILRKTGYQVGTGVMIGLPFQSAQSLAGDIMFFKAMDIDMLGMGPYIPHHGTPLAARVDDYTPEARFNMTLRMIALCRLLMPGINIASTTALQALNPYGREMGLKAGANVIMPNITPGKYRQDYELYPGKPCVSDTPDECGECLTRRVKSIGETIGVGEWGDSPHAVARKKGVEVYG